MCPYKLVMGWCSPPMSSMLCIDVTYLLTSCLDDDNKRTGPDGSRGKVTDYTVNINNWPWSVQDINTDSGRGNQPVKTVEPITTPRTRRSSQKHEGVELYAGKSEITRIFSKLYES